MLRLGGRWAVALAVGLVLHAVAAAQPSASQPRPIELVVVGDSLSAGLGLAVADTFPAQLERALAARGRSVKVINAGVSGDTASEGLARLDWSVGPETDAVIVELGANDALRGTNPAVTRAALTGMLARLRERGLPVLLAGMLAPRNMGAPFAAAFDPIYADLAAQFGMPLYPFFLDGVATNPELTQSDGMHPNAAGVRVIVERILPAVEALLDGAQR
jgi:acyl-CoA thioesterase-1